MSSLTVISYDVGYEMAVDSKSVPLTLGIDGPVIGRVDNIRKSGRTVVGDVVIFDGRLKSIVDVSLDKFELKSCSIEGIAP